MKSIHFSFGKIISISILTFLLIASCDVTDPKKDRPKPEGYQEDIPWPSLADSPWPMSLHDPQATGRTKYIGPYQGIVDWVLDSLVNYESAPVVGKNGTIYTCAPTIWSPDPIKYGGLLAIDPSGKIKWNYNLGLSAELIPAPVVSSEGVIYVLGGDGPIDSLYAITTEGKLKWKKQLPTEGYHHVTQTSIVIGKNGNLYFGDVMGNFYCFDKNGNLIWVKKLEYGLKSVTQLSFSPDGDVIYYSSIVSIVAISSSTGDILWTYGNKLTNITPILDYKGNIYTIIKTENKWEQKLICVDKDANLIWSFTFFCRDFESSFVQPCIDKLGNIYFGQDSIYSVNFNGKLRWKLPIAISTPIICDGNNDIYFANKTISNSTIYSYTSEGLNRWSININEFVANSAAISNNNTLLQPTTFSGDRLFSIK